MLFYFFSTHLTPALYTTFKISSQLTFFPPFFVYFLALEFSLLAMFQTFKRSLDFGILTLLWVRVCLYWTAYLTAALQEQSNILRCFGVFLVFFKEKPDWTTNGVDCMAYLELNWLGIDPCSHERSVVIGSDWLLFFFFIKTLTPYISEREYI